jgi:hypothetical protein
MGGRGGYLETDLRFDKIIFLQREEWGKTFPSVLEHTRGIKPLGIIHIVC